MLPNYRHMDSYPQSHPYQKWHTPYPNLYHPSWEVVSPQTNVDPVKSPITYGPWSYGGNFGKSNSMECHGCCNHIYPPGYYSVRPPYLHPPPPPTPLYYHGPYPPCPEAYMPYHAPHYSMEKPWYEYDKDMHEKHCCGCRNHVCNKGVKIEEHKLESGTKESKRLGPVKLENNYPYPFIWIPPEYVKNIDSSKTSDFEPMTWSGWYPFGMKNDDETGKTFKSDSKNGWFPLSLQQAGDDKGNQSQNNEEKTGQFPFPMVWVPTYNKPEEVEKKDLNEPSTSPKLTEEPSKLKIIPLKLCRNDDRGENPGPGVLEDASGNGILTKAGEKDVKCKIIPVQHIVESGKNISVEKKPNETRVKQTKENDKKCSDNIGKKQISSSSKASKLSPVCLRVDPLPRKKKSNGTSRSLSPTGPKLTEQQNSNAAKDTPSSPVVEHKVCSGSAVQASIQSKVEEIEPSKEAIGVLAETERKNRGKEEVPWNRDQPQICTTVPVVSNEEVPGRLTTGNGELHEREEKPEDKGASEAIGKTLSEGGKEKKEFSVNEAAVIIQSVYRGFEVRKWEPLKKLKHIKKIHEQVDEMAERMRNLESSTDLRKDEKQVVLIGETIMNLLLQLDTIQGLHPSFRDIRKSAARRLVSLQERLDSIIRQKAEEAERPKATESSKTSLEEGLCETALDTEFVPPVTTDNLKEAEECLKVEEPSCEAVEDAQKDGVDKVWESTEAEDRLIVAEVVDHASECDVHLLEELPVGVVDETPTFDSEQNLEFVLGKEDSVSQDKDLDYMAKDVPASPMIEKGHIEDIAEVPKRELQLSEKETRLEEEPLGIHEHVHLFDEDNSSEPACEAGIVMPQEHMEATIEENEDDKRNNPLEETNMPDVDKPMEKDITEVPKQDQLSVEKGLHEESLRTHENAHSCGGDNFSESAYGTGIAVMPQEDEEATTEKNKDDKSHSPVEEMEVPEVEKPVNREIGDPCLDSEDLKNPPTEEEIENLELEAVKDERAMFLGKSGTVEQVGINKEDEDLSPAADTPDLNKPQWDRKEDIKLMKENEKLREMVEKLIQETKQQLTVISDLNGRVKDLERRLTKRKKLKMRRHREARVSPCVNNLKKEGSVGCSV